MHLDQASQVLYVGTHAFRGYAVNVDQLVVVAIDEVPLHVEHVGEAAGESRAEIHAGAPQHSHHAARHVFAAMIARALHHGQRA